MPAVSVNKYTCGRYLAALAVAKGDPLVAMAYAESQGQWLDRSSVVSSLKTAVGALADGDLGASPAADAFLNVLRDYSVPLRLEGLRRAPMRTRILQATTGTTAGEITEGTAIPPASQVWGAVTLTPRKFAAMTVQSMELVQSASPAAAIALQEDLAGAVGDVENRKFCAPWESGSVLYGASNFNESGTSGQHIGADLSSLAALVPGAYRGGAWLMHPDTAAYIGGLGAVTGSPTFGNVGPAGGVLLGLPVITTTAMGQVGSPASRAIGLIAPSEIFYADDGSVQLTASMQASIEMTDTPTGDASDGTQGVTSVVSMFQAGAVALRAIRTTSWKARAGSGAYFSVSY
jgi:hypothetical protein